MKTIEEKSHQEIKPDITIQRINDLACIAKLLTPISLELYSLTGQVPTVTDLVDIAYANFERAEAIKQVILKLTPDGWLPPRAKGIFTVESKNRHDFNTSQGKILSMGKVLMNYSPKRYRSLILEHLSVSKNGAVELPKNATRKIKAETP